MVGYDEAKRIALERFQRRYVERLLQSATHADPDSKPADGIALSTLAEHGFLN